ncbi:MAG: hypothetical protein J6V80_04325 [Clostridia bacterium]|nr:hypothetical protein [Clostridia bacterium]
MLASEREKLFDPKREYVSIGISDGGVCYSVTPVMWENTASAFNMKTPELFIAPEDLLDREIFDRICSLQVLGLYVYTSLDDYRFISHFHDLRDLHVRCCAKLCDLDFLSDLTDLGMLFLEGASLRDVDVIWEVKASGRGFMPYRQVGLFDCNIDRAPKVDVEKQGFTEFLVWSRAENSARDRELWKDVAAFTKKYYTIK